MASPQAENGHTDISNEIIDHLAKMRIPGQEMQVLWVIFRKTWGWHKKKDVISHSQFARATGIKRRHIGELLQNLLDKKLITKNSDSFICKYGIQKDWERWKLSLKKVTVANITKNNDSTVTKKGDETVTKDSAHKRKKETIKKEVMQNHHLDDSKDPGKEKIIDKLMKGWGDKHPESFQFRGVGGRIKMREGIGLCLTEGIEPGVIVERIEKAGNQNPWHIFSDEWLQKRRKEKESYDKLTEKYSNK